MPISNPHIDFVPLSVALSRPGQYRNYFWLVLDDNILLADCIPQGSMFHMVAEYLQRSFFPAAKVRFFEDVYIPRQQYTRGMVRPWLDGRTSLSQLRSSSRCSISIEPVGTQLELPLSHEKGA